MRVGIISPVAWRTPPKDYGPWERVASLIAEGLLREGIDVKLFATADSKTKGQLSAIVSVGYEENKEIDPKVAEYLHLGHLFQNISDVDIVHNNYDFMPLAFSPLINKPMLTTIHGFSSPKIIPVYEKYNENTYYVSISNFDRSNVLRYEGTVYHGIDLESFSFNENPGDYLLYFGRIHWDKGTKEAIEIAKRCKRKLLIAGIIQDDEYFTKYVKPHLDDQIKFLGSANPEKRNDLLRNAYCLIHPINFNEPFGLSVVEAMACGTPVIAFPKGSMPEIITDNETGFLPRSIDEFVGCVNKIPNISRKKCLEEAEKRFSQKRMVRDYIDIYKNVINKYNKKWRL